MVHRYLQDRVRELGAQAVRRTRIYLDTNYWAVLRDHSAGSRPRPECEDLLRILRPAISDGRAFCTYSSHTFHELLKHASASTREATATLIDELSVGFCLANPERLLANEIVHWIGADIAKLSRLHSLTELAWTRPFFIVVDYSPPPQGSELLRQLAYRQFVESVWSWGLRDVLQQIHARPEAYPISDWTERSAAVINADASEHHKPSFEELYLDETNGFLDWAQDMLGQRYWEAAVYYRLDNAPTNEQEAQQAGRALRNALFALAEVDRLGDRLASMQIRSRLFAAVRHDQRRRFKPNDFIDFEHALTALPHCNYFLTDKPHADLIKKAKLIDRFPCRIIASLPEAVRILGTASMQAHASN